MRDEAIMHEHALHTILSLSANTLRITVIVYRGYSLHILSRRMINKSMRPLVASLVLAFAMFCSNFVSVASFTAPSANMLRNEGSNLLGSGNGRISTSYPVVPNMTALQMAAGDDESYDKRKIDGSNGGTYFMALVLLVNVWLFTIPTEFRRAHLYPEGNAGLYSDPKGITAKDWAAGVAQYYANGGGIKFDFSIEGNE
jgi:hypothetical protein